MSCRLWAGVLAAVCLCSWVLASPAAAATSPAPPPRASPGSRHGPAHVRYQDTGLLLALPSLAQPSREVRWSVVGARPVKPQAEPARPGPPGASHSEGMRYPGALPGVDLWVEQRDEGLEYGFRAERGGALRQVRMEYTGVKAVRVVEDGRGLEVALEDGLVRERGLRCTQEPVKGPEYAVGCRFADARRVQEGRWQYAIEVDVVDPRRPVVVDPTIEWTNYLGFERDDMFGGIVRDPTTGEVFITGTLPEETKAPADSIPDGLPGNAQAKILTARFSANGTLKAWRILDGSGEDVSHAIAFRDGNLLIAGRSSSSNFGSIPIKSGTSGGQNGFLAQLNPETLQTQWVYLVDINNQTDVIRDLAILANGDVIGVGFTFPGTGSIESPPPVHECPDCPARDQQERCRDDGHGELANRVGGGDQPEHGLRGRPGQ